MKEKEKEEKKSLLSQLICHCMTSKELVVVVAVVTGFECPVNRAGSPPDSQTRVTSKYTFKNWPVTTLAVL